MTINDQIYDRLEAFDIKPKEAAVLYLLAIYYKINPNGIIDQEVMTQVNLTKIVERDYGKSTLKWNVSLFFNDEFVVEDNWTWVLTEYRNVWMEIMGSKGGDKRTCIDKMKKFFAAHPDIRKYNVMDAAMHYTDEFRSGNNPKYMVEADNFIYKKVEGINKSKLEQVLEQMKISEQKQSNQSNRYDGKIR